jgi:hypothetical protein
VIIGGVVTQDSQGLLPLVHCILCIEESLFHFSGGEIQIRQLKPLVQGGMAIKR